MTIRFVVLAIDAGSQTVISTENQILHAMMAHNALWRQPDLNIKQRRITDGQTSLAIAKIELDSTTYPEGGNGYVLELQGEFSDIESSRLVILRHLQSQGFELRYVLKDEVSEAIACQLYPLLYQVENALRAYIIKFMVTKLGSKWWEITATTEQSGKATNRSNNETEFSRHSDNRAYLIDFGDLGRIIYQQSAGFKNTVDLVRQILDVAETPDAIQALKARLQTNYQRFFKETFKDRDFQSKWEYFEKLRRKIAHNNLFTLEDLLQGRKTANELIDIIEAADRSSLSLEIPADEKAALRASFTPVGYSWDIVTQDEFLRELRLQEEYFLPDGYVGLAHFVRTVLGEKGFDYAGSYRLAEELNNKGIIEKYDVAGERDGNLLPAIRMHKGESLVKRSSEV